MSSLWIAVLAIAVAPVNGANVATVGHSTRTAAVTSTTVPEKKPQALRKAFHAALAGEATAPNKKEWHAAVRRLIKVYGEIKRSKSLSRKERTRLLTIMRMRLAKAQKKLTPKKTKTHKKSVAKKPVDDGDHLLSADIEAVQAARQVIPAMAAMQNQLRHRPNHNMNHQNRPMNRAAGIAGRPHGAMAGGAADGGEALVELIQKTIAPATWEINGGKGTIYYFHQRKVLVIRQTSEVHGEMGGLIDGLRRAGP